MAGAKQTAVVAAVVVDSASPAGKRGLERRAPVAIEGKVAEVGGTLLEEPLV